MPITISSPQPYRVFQRSDLNWADIPISGTYIGTPTAIEASFNGGAWTTIVASPAGGVYSGTLTNQNAGQGTLTVRFTNDTTQNAAVNFVGIGDIFFVIGQSNAVGNGTNNQVYSHPSLKAAMWHVGDTAWAEMVDPTGYFGHGSAWPLLATLHMASQGVPFAIVSGAVNATGLVSSGNDWQKGQAIYEQALTTLANSGVNGIKAILWYQGEGDAGAGASQAAYQTALSQMLDDMQADSAALAGVKMVCASIGDHAPANAPGLNRIRAAQMDRWDNDPDIQAGPAMYDVDVTDGDGSHIGTGIDGDAELQTEANRWWRMLSYWYYGSLQGRGPRFVSATRNGLQVTVTLTGGVRPYDGRTDLTGWRSLDDGARIPIVNAIGSGSSKIVLTLASLPVGVEQISFGHGRDAHSTTLMDGGLYPLPPEPFVDRPVTISITPASTGSIVLDTAFAFYVDVEDLAGNKVGNGPLTSVSKWRYTASMDKAGSFECSYLATDNQAAQVQSERYLRAWALLNGFWTEVGYGRVDAIDLTPDEDGIVSVNASGLDVTVELTDRSVRKLAIGTGTGTSHDIALSAISAFAPAGWAFIPADNPDNDYIYARFAGESVLAAMAELAEKTQTHFYRSQGRELTFTNTFEASDIRAIQATGALTPQTCAITSLRRSVTTHGLLTRIYPYGSGTGDARLTLAATSRTAPAGYLLNKVENYIEDSTATAAYGLREVPEIDFKEITPIANTNADLQSASNMLFDAAMLELRRRATLAQQYTYELAIGGCSQLLRPMQSLRVVYFDPDQNIDIDEELYILESTWEADQDGIRTSRLVVSTDDRWPGSDIDSAAERAVEGKVFIAHPQIGPNSYWENGTLYVGSDQTNHVAEFPFVLGNEVVNVQQVLFRFTVQPVLSFATTVAGSTTTTPSGGGSTTVDGGASTTPNGGSGTSDVTTANPYNHGHALEFNQTAASPGFPVRYDPAAGGTLYYVNGGSGPNTGGATGLTNLNSHTHTTPNHIHSTPNHHHDTPNHVHIFTPNISTAYGIFRASASRTYAMADMEIAVNGGSWVSLDTAAAVGLGYFQLDITPAIQDPVTFRPYQENNLVEIRRKASAGSVAINNSTGGGTSVSFSTNPTPHGIAAGEQVIVSGTAHHNGTWTVTSVPDSLTFSTNQTGDNNLDFGGTVQVNKSAMLLCKLGVRNSIQAVSFT